MYIEYIRNQREAEEGQLSNLPGIHCPLEDSEVPEFKPTWLVRVSDMQVVPGSSVNGHYWALSYSWNQSGELIYKGCKGFDRIDEGRHEIIEYRRTPYHVMHNIDGVMKVTDTDFDPETASTKYVTFEGFIQQIYKDFDIDYIWYDQMCINQGDDEEKMREIKQMHLIYANALCTVALVPELRYSIEHGEFGKADLRVIRDSQWCKRMWTLEEAYVSGKILLLGRNVHHWSTVGLIWNVGAYYYQAWHRMVGTKRMWMACTTLWYAKRRTSSKAHDRIFALANIYPELMDGITFNYKQPLLDLMIQFYGNLARKDLSILMFSAPSESNQDDEITALEASLLPSWTGAGGVHLTEFQLVATRVLNSYSIAGSCMRLTSSFVTARLKKRDDVMICTTT